MKNLMNKEYAYYYFDDVSSDRLTIVPTVPVYTTI
jgi:hypothetical protein